MVRRIFVATALAVGLFASTLNAQGPAGRWQGKWISHSTGHQGPLRAWVRPGSNGEYRAVFAGRFALIIPFAYRATLKPTTCSGVYTSTKQLPLIGEYRMQATVTSQGLRATFQSGKDEGIFDLKPR